MVGLHTRLHGSFAVRLDMKPHSIISLSQLSNLRQKVDVYRGGITRYANVGRRRMAGLPILEFASTCSWCRLYASIAMKMVAQLGV